MTPTDAAFLKAITTIKSLSRGPNALGKPPDDRKIQLYGWYKQATEGDVEGIMPRPEGDDPQSRSNQQKWDAWKSHEGTSKQRAKLAYVEYLLETMRGLMPADSENAPSSSDTKANSATNLDWADLESAFDLAKRTIADTDSVATSRASAVANPQSSSQHQPSSLNQIPSGHRSFNYHGSSNHGRRLSAGSLNSSYSHFLRNPIITSSSSVRNSSFSEFGLSEKDQNELHADQLVNRMQTAYPPVIPGAVVPDVWQGKPLDPTIDVISPSQVTNPISVPDRMVSRGHSGKDDNNGSSKMTFPKWLMICFATVEQWVAHSLENILHRLVIDTFKIFLLLLLMRIIASRPHLLQRSPLLKRILNTAGKVIVVVFDGFGIELKLKTPAPVEALKLAHH